jgi:large subunit ribosomal protein L5
MATKKIHSIKEREAEAYGALKERLGYKNIMQSPRLLKVVVSSGTGSIKDKNKIALVKERLGKITGQLPVDRKAKKAIANFKSRLGDTMGYQVTLRGPRARDFLDRLFAISLPRTRDFRGISRSIVDEAGNATIGIREHNIFPETADEELKDIFGLSATIVTTAPNKKEAEAYLEHLGLPFRKTEEKKK